jgi:diadenosine tetraphosphatase ApaH/serine/threonine PP2A family protein phosphatase
MQNKPYFIIGDPHGCINELQDLVYNTQANGPEQIIIVGDLVDRGPDSAGVVRFCRENKLKCILGNHEEKYLRYRNHELKRVKDPKYKNPMKFSQDKLDVYNSLTLEDFDYIEQMPLYLKLGNMVVCHGGINKTALETPKKEIIRRRYVFPGSLAMAPLGHDHKAPAGSVFWSEVHTGPESVIYGHNVHSLTDIKIDNPVPGVFCYGIDTGCCFGGKLTAMVLDDSFDEPFYPNLIQVQSRKTYFNQNRVFDD